MGMDLAVSDNELVGDYARQGSETAFRALVARHVNLVFGTAFRQTGDVGMAEEVAQNVFLALARKAPRLVGHETLAGWLHRTALLESKARIRSEWRRQRREETAAALASIEMTAGSPMEELKPLLDEGLISLRESDRLVLVLRFLEERSLGEVAAILGVNEEAARKRVSRAVRSLSAFFQVRGFSLPSASGAALLQQSAVSAPPGLAATAAASGLATSVGGGSGGMALTIFWQVMQLTKTPTTLVCALLVGAPIAWQERTARDVQRDHQLAVRQFSEQQVTLAGLQAERMALQEALARRTVSARFAQERLGELETDLASREEPMPYRWEDAQPLVRLPKSLLRESVPVAVTGRSGELTPAIRSVLRLTDEETQGVQDALNHLLDSYHSVMGEVARSVDPIPQELRGMDSGDVRVMEVTGHRERVEALQVALLEELGSLLGDERSALLSRGLESWMPLPGQSQGMSSARAVWPDDHRVAYYRSQVTADKVPMLGWGVYTSGVGSMWSTIVPEEIPPPMQPLLSDWIDEVRWRQEWWEASQASAAPGGDQ